MNYDNSDNSLKDLVLDDNYYPSNILGCSYGDRIIYNTDYINSNMDIFITKIIPHEIAHYLHKNIPVENIDMILCNTMDYPEYSRNGYFDSKPHGLTFKLIEKQVKLLF